MIRRTLAMLVVWCVALAPCARAGDAFEIARILPGNVDAALVVEEASSWRRGPVGAALQATLAPKLASSQLGSAWQTLSKAFGLDEAQAFDAFLGQRVLLATRAGGVAGATSQWVLVSVVSDESERLLTDLMKPSPRRFEHGLPVYSIENGALWLVIRPAPKGSLFMFGPSNAPELFREVLAKLALPDEASLSTQPLVTKLRERADQPHIWGTAKLGSAEPGRDGVIGATIRIAGPDVLCNVVVLAPERASGQPERQWPEWDRTVFDRVATDSLLTVAEDLRGSELQAGLLPEVWREVSKVAGFPADLRARVGPRVMVSIARADAGPAAVLALETPDLDTFAPLADSYFSGFAEQLQGVQRRGPMATGGESPPGGAADWASPVLNLNGQFPGTMRRVDLSNTPWVAGMPFAPDDLELAWLFAGGPVRGDEAGTGAASAGGWLLLGTKAPSVREVRSILNTKRGGTGGAGVRAQWLSLGEVRPRELAELARKSGVEALTGAQIVGAGLRVERLSWALKRVDGQTIAGTARVRMWEVPVAENVVGGEAGGPGPLPLEPLP